MVTSLDQGDGLGPRKVRRWVGLLGLLLAAASATARGGAMTHSLARPHGARPVVGIRASHAVPLRWLHAQAANPRHFLHETSLHVQSLSLGSDSHIAGELTALMATTGSLPNTSFVNYLIQRRSIDPSRFDFYHPRTGALLTQPFPTQVTTTALVPTGPTSLLPEVVTPTAPLVPLHPAKETVPEPGTVWVALVCLGAGTVWARRNRGAGGPRTMSGDRVA